MKRSHVRKRFAAFSAALGNPHARARTRTRTRAGMYMHTQVINALRSMGTQTTRNTCVCVQR